MEEDASEIFPTLHMIIVPNRQQTDNPAQYMPLSPQHPEMLTICIQENKQTTFALAQPDQLPLIQHTRVTQTNK